MPDRVTLKLEKINAEEHRGRHAGPIDPAEYEQSHYLATLTYQRRSARYRYTTGAAWERPPVAREVLESVLSDSATLGGAETAAAARDAIRSSFGDDVDDVGKLAQALLTADQKTRRLLGDDYEPAISDPEGWAWAHTDEPPTWISRSQRPAGGTSYSGAVGITKNGDPVRVKIELRAGKDGPELAISGSTPHGGGQNLETFEELETYTAPWTAEKVAELLEIWRAWHLNGMRAHCSHQTGPEWDTSRPLTLYHWRTTRLVRDRLRDAEKEATKQLRAGESVTLPADVLELAALPATVTTSEPTPPAQHTADYEPNGPQYEGDHYSRASETKTAGWVRPEEHPGGLLGKPCPTCGYAYGSAWLFEQLPADVLEWLNNNVGVRPPHTVTA